MVIALCRELQVLWVSRALRGPEDFQALRDLKDTRAREEMRGQQELLDLKGML